MRTTIDLDDELLADALEAFPNRTKTDVLELGLQSLLRRLAAHEIVQLQGAAPEARAPRRRRAQ